MLAQRGETLLLNVPAKIVSLRSIAGSVVEARQSIRVDRARKHPHFREGTDLLDDEDCCRRRMPLFAPNH